MTTVRLSSHARKSYLKLAKADRRLFERLDRALEGLGEDAHRGKPLAGPLVGHRSLRVGSLRIVYRIEDEELEVLVLEIGQRGSVYR